MAAIRASKTAKRQARKAIKLTDQKQKAPPLISIPPLVPRNAAQRHYLHSLNNFAQVFGIGPAGTGKTYVAVHWAVQQVLDKKADKIIITRPMVSSDKSESLGYLPGNLAEKFGPWALPIMDVIERLIGKVKTADWLKTGAIEFAPFQMVRGRTFHEGAIVLLDEAQNCSIEQLKLFVTRLGDCRCIVSGDPQQADIKNSGLNTLMKMVSKHGIPASICNFGNEDVVRSKLCAAWVKAFDNKSAQTPKNDTILVDTPAFYDPYPVHDHRYILAAE
jgi:phosphate starvation-inducible PhoH-like protein